MSSPPAPERFGRFHLLHRIAVGGMAEVHLAHDTADLDPHSLVVIKRLRSELEKDEDFVRMFLDESSVISRLDHVGIIQVLEYGAVDGHHFIALEHVWGESLATLTTLCTRQRIRFPLGAALYIGAETAEALHHAHNLCDEFGLSSPVIHRDVTLGNVMVAYDGTVKVLDFGIAKADERLAHTRVGQIKGTLVYLAPEQVRGAPVSPATDVYQLGVLLYKTLVGCEPFTGRSEIEVMEAIIAGHVLRPTQVIKGFPPAIEALVLKAMARRESQRFGSMAQLSQILRSLLGSAFEDGSQRLSRIVARITGDRAERQLGYIRGRLDGLDVDHLDGEMIRWGNIDEEPRTLAVELSAILEVGDASEPGDGDTQVTERDSLGLDAVDDDEERDGRTLAEALRTEVVQRADVLDVLASGPSTLATVLPRDEGQSALADDVFVRALDREAPSLSDVFRSDALLVHVTRPDLPDFFRLLEAEGQMADAGLFEDEPPPTVPLSDLLPGALPTASVGTTRADKPVALDQDAVPAGNPSLGGISHETERETRVDLATPRPQATPLVAQAAPLAAPAAADEDDVFQPTDDLDFDIDVADDED
ncbi:MAG: serine/threonine-protein kinase [Pseudomonadota bacterium]